MREKYMRLREQNPPVYTPKPPPTILPFDSIERYIYLPEQRRLFCLSYKKMDYVNILSINVFISQK